MTFIKKVSNVDVGDADHAGGDDWDTLDNYHDNVDITPKVAKVNTRTYFRSGKVELRNPADTFSNILISSSIAANRNITIPLLTANGNMVIDSFSNTFTAPQILNNNTPIQEKDSAGTPRQITQIDGVNNLIFGDTAGIVSTFIWSGNATAAFQINAFNRVLISPEWWVDLKIVDKNIVLSATTGTMIGTGPTQKLGFFGKTPIVQKPADPNTTGAALAALETEVNALKQILRDYGLLAP